jgi:Fe-S-cluster containining protein
MDDLLKNLASNAKSNRKNNKKVVERLKKRYTNQEIDQIFHKEHEKAFEKIDCLSCANCCKTTGPLFTNKDIVRISGKLKLPQQQFIEKYLRVDEDNDYVLQQTPCTFLGDDNYCSIYEFRPKACRDYPHTDRVKQYPLLNLNVKNTEVCPAVFQMFEEIKKTISQ